MNVRRERSLYLIFREFLRIISDYVFIKIFCFMHELKLEYI
jgi:hypothetical protein